MKYKVTYSSKFKKGLKLAKKQHKNLKRLWYVVNMLSNGEELPQVFNDHKLSGDMKNFRSCHIESDWVLIYVYIENRLVLYLYNIGSHQITYKGKY